MKRIHPTRQRVLINALKIASVQGIQGTTIGVVAKESKLSKSGMFSHFDSKESLQVAMIDEARELFIVHVINKTIDDAPGLNKLRALFVAWLEWVPRSGFAGSCPFVHAVSEFAALAEPVRNRVAEVQKQWFNVLKDQVHTAIQQHELPDELDIEYLVFEILGLYLAHQWDIQIKAIGGADIKAITAFDRLIMNCRNMSNQAVWAAPSINDGVKLQRLE